MIFFNINLFCSLLGHRQLRKQQSQVAIELEHSMWNLGAWWHLPAGPSLTSVDCKVYFTNFSWPYLILAGKRIQHLTTTVFPYLVLYKIICWVLCSKYLARIAEGLVMKKNDRFRPIFPRASPFCHLSAGVELHKAWGVVLVCVPQRSVLFLAHLSLTCA